MNLNKSIKAITIIGFFSLILSINAYPIGKSYQPLQPDSIILVLPKGFSYLSNEIRELKGDNILNSDELKGSVQKLLGLVDKTGDEQYLGLAQTILADYEDKNKLNQDLKILKAKILQKQHKFDQALTLLEKVLTFNSASAEANLVTAYIYFALGQANQAINHCNEIENYYGSIISLSCAIKAKALVGDMVNSVATLEAIYKLPNLSMYESREVALTLSEILLMQGDYELAKKYFADLLSKSEGDHYVLLQIADLNNYLGDFKDNINLLKNYSSPSLKLRLALSQLKMTGKIESELEARLSNYFEQELFRNNDYVSADYGEFLYSIEKNYQQAYSIALINWRNQKGLVDTALLIKAAIRANEMQTLKEVSQWVSTSNLKDERISALLASAEVRL